MQFKFSKKTLDIINETIVNESEDIWTDIKSKLQQDASTQFAGNQSKLDAFNSGVNSAEEEAIKITNDTEQGLGNYLQTEDKEKAKRVAKKLRSGCVYINGNGADPGTPFGGYRQSGNGREGGLWGLEEYLEVKTICGWGQFFLPLKKFYTSIFFK